MKKLSKSTLRWYIGTKSLMPIVDIRRRFGFDGDEITVIEDDLGKLYVGLPPVAAQALEELRRQGKIGYQLSVDVHARVLVGAYAICKQKRDEVPPDGDGQQEQLQESEQEASENAA